MSGGLTGAYRSTVQANGSAVAPAANAAIATLAAPASGRYNVVVQFIYGPTADGPANVQLKAGATVVAVLPNPATNLALFTSPTYSVVLDGVTALTVNAIAAGGAGSQYFASIVAERIA